MNTSPIDVDTTPDVPPTARKRKGQVITWSGFIVAFILLANPMPLLFDLLPDAIAYLLILFSLRRSVGEIDVFDDCKKSTNKLLILSALKLPAFFIMANIWGGDSRERAIVAVFTLSFSIFEFLFLRTWTHDLFDAVARYGQRYDCHAALAETGSGFCMSPERLETLTLIFFAVRSLLSCLPEMTLVPMPTSDSASFFNWNSMYPACAIVAGVAVLIFGVIWCCYIIAYFLRVRSDRDAAKRMYADITLGSRAERENDNRLIRLATFFLIGAVILQFDIILDNMNYLPDVLSALLFFAVGYTLHNLLGKHYAAYIVPLVYAGTSLAHLVLRARFYANFTDADLVLRKTGALGSYIPVVITGIANGILLITICILLLLAFCRVVERYTGISRGGLTERRIDEQLRHAPPAEEFTLRCAYGVIAMRTKRELRIKWIILTVIGAISALLATGVDLIMLVAPEPLDGIGRDPSFFTRFAYGGIETITMVSVVVWLFFAVHICSRMRREAEINLIEE